MWGVWGVWGVWVCVAGGTPLGRTHNLPRAVPGKCSTRDQPPAAQLNLIFLISDGEESPKALGWWGPVSTD